MCGRFNLIDSPEVRSLCDSLGVQIPNSCISQDIAPGGQIAVIYESRSGLAKKRRVSQAIWWLFLDRKTLKPDYRYASFNSRSDKLHKPQGISYIPYRESRCIIPASAFVEGLGDKKTYHMIELEEQPLPSAGFIRSTAISRQERVFTRPRSSPCLRCRRSGTIFMRNRCL